MKIIFYAFECPYFADMADPGGRAEGEPGGVCGGPGGTSEASGHRGVASDGTEHPSQWRYGGSNRQGIATGI